MSSAPEKTRKIREKAKLYNREPRKNVKDVSKTSAKPLEKAGRENLALSDWLTVLESLDDHLSMSQSDIIVSYFVTKADGAHGNVHRPPYHEIFYLDQSHNFQIG
jgi:hypothetical protein